MKVQYTLFLMVNGSKYLNMPTLIHQLKQDTPPPPTPQQNKMNQEYMKMIGSRQNVDVKKINKIPKYFIGRDGHILYEKHSNYFVTKYQRRQTLSYLFRGLIFCKSKIPNIFRDIKTRITGHSLSILLCTYISPFKFSCVAASVFADFIVMSSSFTVIFYGVKKHVCINLAYFN